MRSPQANKRAPIDRALWLLDAFPDAGATSVTELARTTGWAKSTVHSVLAPLIRQGAVERVDGRVRLGLRLFELGQRVPRQRTLRSVALPYMDDLLVATGETVHLAIPDGVEIVYIEKLSRHGTTLAPSTVGGRMPMHCSAVGKAILANTSRESFGAVVASGLTRMTERTITSSKSLERELDAVRADGIAYDREELRPNLVCVAAPIVDSDGCAVGALSVAGAAKRASFAPVRMAPAVRTAARAISRALPPRTLLALH